MNRVLRPRCLWSPASGACILVLSLIPSLGCSQQAPPPVASAQQTVAPQRIEHPTVVLPDGFTVELELAVTPLEVANGLMYRPSLPENRGMLFVFENDRFPSFWMKNTLISLDLVFLDSSGAVVDVVAEVPPCAADPCPTYSPDNPARAVLELVAGAAAAHEVEAGAVLEFRNTSSYPVAEEEVETPVG